MVTLTGAPGVGKSRLAYEVLDQLDKTAAPPAAVVAVDHLGWFTDPRRVAPTVVALLKRVFEWSQPGSMSRTMSSCSTIVTAS